MKVGILTSSRADYGIYLPLLKELHEDPYFDLEIIAFGTHLSPFHGYTISNILQDGFEVKFKIQTLLVGDDEDAIASSTALTSLKFAEFWSMNSKEFDLVFCLGDRYEMFGAVSAGIPYNIIFAHLYGGETTLGAIDNVYRHCITLCSKYHFVSTPSYKEKVAEIIGENDNIFIIGSLSLDNLNNIELFSFDEFKYNYDIDLRVDSLLITIHPETREIGMNMNNAKECYLALEELQKDFQLIITMPNADTNSFIYRRLSGNLKTKFPGRVNVIENLGTQGYFTCMKYCSLLIGNSSSGIIEAASFHKYVINVGKRQNGRICSNNVVNVPFNAHKIVAAVREIKKRELYNGINVYYQGGAVNKIISFLKGFKEN